jgi:nitrite reductase/ring-hydroxylating ferredoxin subunit
LSQDIQIERVWTTPAGVNLGPLDQIADPGARNYVLRIGDKRFHGFVVRRGAAAFGYVDRCPHAGLPLAQVLDRYLTEDGSLIACSWHGALFQPETGICVGGPCVGARLSPWPVRVEDGRIITA